MYCDLYSYLQLDPVVTEQKKDIGESLSVTREVIQYYDILMIWYNERLIYTLTSCHTRKYNTIKINYLTFAPSVIAYNAFYDKLENA